jgi:NAD(P)-dependent dehydrogenase (short-subunit alcohol dehydrogenase family)
MNISESVALVTGANRGLGKARVQALRAAGCAKLYAAARDINTIAEMDGVIPILLDITKSDQVAAGAAQCRDVTLLINNAGVAGFTPALDAPTMDNARREMETNYFGTLAMCRSFAAVLKANGGGALVNVLSVVSWSNVPMQGTYCASKSAEWSLTKAVRFELRAQGTRVSGVYAGYIDTAMTTSIDLPKSTPEAIAARMLAGIQAGEEEILADERAETIRAQLLKDEGPFEANTQAIWDDFKRGQATSV